MVYKAIASSSLLKSFQRPLSTLSSLSPAKPLPIAPPTLSPSPLSTKTALKLLQSQPSHYISILLLGRRYLLTARDVLTVPKMKGVKPGDRIELTRILEIGSRDFTLRATPTSKSLAAAATANLNSTAEINLESLEIASIPRDWQRHPDSLPYLEAGLVKSSLTVIEHTKGEMFEVDKFKKRKGYRRTLRSKLGFTKLRVGEIEICAEE